MAFSDLSRYGLGVILLIGAMTFLAALRLANKIRAHYPDLYDNIGRPTLLPQRSIIEQWRFVRFIIRREYSRLDNMELKLLGDVILFGSLINIGLILFGAFLQLKW